MTDSFYQSCADIIGHEHLAADVDPPVLSPPDINVSAELFRHVHASGRSVIIKGGGTWPVPARVHDQIIVSTSAMNAVQAVEEQDFILVAGAGTTPDTAIETSEIAGLTFPVDRLYGSRMTLGGLFMSGAVNPGMSDSGLFVRSVLGVRGVTANGDIVSFGGRTKKNVTGYEVTRFLAGSMGLYMLACELTIMVHPIPDRRMVLRAQFGSCPDAIEAISSILPRMISEPSSLELVAPAGLEGASDLLIGVSGNRETVEQRIETVTGILERNGAETVTSMRLEEALKIRRENSGTFPSDGMVTYCMPRSAVATFLRRGAAVAPSLPLHLFPGDGIIHAAAGDDLFLKDALSEAVCAVGGKQPLNWNGIRENGIGGLLNPAEIGLVKSLKAKLDPSGVLNPHIRL